MHDENSSSPMPAGEIITRRISSRGNGAGRAYPPDVESRARIGSVPWNTRYATRTYCGNCRTTGPVDAACTAEGR